MDVRSLSDAQVIAGLQQLAAADRRNLRAFIEHLREFDDRKLAGDTPHATTFVYCTKALKLTEGEAYRRMQVAGVADRFPRLLDLIEQGRLSLTTASLLAPHLNKSNFEELTAKAAGQPRREVEFIVAALAPKHIPADLIRGLPPPSGPSAFAAVPQADQTAGGAMIQPQKADGLPVRVEALTATAARVHFTATRDLLDKIERARALLRHKYPKADYNEIFDEALEALLARRDPDRKTKPAPVRDVLPGRRRIPQWVKDEVWSRDSGRCAFVSLEGARCGATSWLEYDHLRPFALGGRSDDPANVRLLCRAHNRSAAEEVFG